MAYHSETFVTTSIPKPTTDRSYTCWVVVRRTLCTAVASTSVDSSRQGPANDRVESSRPAAPFLDVHHTDAVEVGNC